MSSLVLLGLCEASENCLGRVAELVYQSVLVLMLTHYHWAFLKPDYLAGIKARQLAHLQSTHVQVRPSSLTTNVIYHSCSSAEVRFCDRPRRVLRHSQLGHG